MSLGALALLAQLAAGAGQPVAPVLAFPEPGLDDTAAYQGYRTRLFRDAAGNTVQVYVEGRAGRVVHLLADAENASIGLTAQDGRGRPVAVRWDGPGAEVARGGPGGRTRTLAHPVVVDAPTVRLGGFVLGTMRVERDYQHARAHERPLGATAHVVPELARLAAGMARLQPTERRRQLALLGAPDLATLEARLRPTVTLLPAGGGARVVQPSLDGRDTLAVELLVDAARVTVSASGDGVTLGARDGASVPLTVRIATTGPTLTPLAREEIFTPAFLAFLARERAAGEAPDAPAPVRAAARRLERQARGVELLVSREKLMAGLPTYATYFGRDMLVTALMMRPIWRPEMSEFAIAAALRKLEPTTAEVSHEEALGAQASREAAAEWVALIEAQGAARRRGAPRAADSLLARSRAVLAAHRRPRENYHMVDDEFQLPVLVARWITDSTVSA
ncbi:MAG TPA: hypothetical protein VEZ47_10525, partial [Gemmatirosa sp.]|nr:hypothetical protein [Gemmatirosa sp.]